MTHLSEVQVLRFLIGFTLLFVTARILADVMKRAGQATVIGELLAGIMFGPSILGHFAPAAYRLLFPADPLADHLLEAVSWIGVIMLLLYTGLETDLEIVIPAQCFLSSGQVGREEGRIGLGLESNLVAGRAFANAVAQHELLKDDRHERVEEQRHEDKREDRAPVA